MPITLALLWVFFALFCTPFVPRAQSGPEVQIWAKLWHTEAHIDTMGHKKSHIMSSNIEIKRVCEFCKNEFTARTTRTRYCSHKCNSRHYKVLERNEKVKKSNQETVKVLNVDLEKIKHREFLNITQASNLFGISRRTVYRLINRGEVNIAKFGKRSVLKRCDLESFFAIPILFL